MFPQTPTLLHARHTHFFTRLLPAVDRRALLGLTLGHPHPPTSRPFSEKTSMIRLPVGPENFRRVIEKKLDFVDKSLFIKELIDEESSDAIVITRPRRFGKTLNLSMLQHFLADNINGKPTKDLFAGLKIMQAGEEYVQHQGKYPVIFISLKDVAGNNFKVAYEQLCAIMSEVYKAHLTLLSSQKLRDSEKREFELILEKKGSETDVTRALRNLTSYLSRHYGVNPWLLIDEYDTPIQAGYVHKYHKEMIGLMQNLFGSALKTNDYLHKAVITGILRIAKENLFSGVNNLKVYSLMHSRYSTHFGFTEEEMDKLLKRADLKTESTAIKAWYNGYQAGDTVLYNPWSIVNCIQENGKLEPYWTNTSDNQLIRDLIARSSTEFKEQFELLLQDKPVEQLIDENTVFDDLEKNESAAWSLLLMAGYLKVTTQRRTEQGLWCTLAIPNQEVRNLYRQIVERWLSNGHGAGWYNQFLEHLLTGDMETFTRELTELMERTVSSHDTANPEAFYHGLLLGLTASLHHNKNYEIQSNRESGYGRFDYMIFSKDQSRPTLLLEFKKVDSVKGDKTRQINLEDAAEVALGQIEAKRYVAAAEQRGCTNILKIGIAFCGKRLKIAHEHIGKSQRLEAGPSKNGH